QGARLDRGALYGRGHLHQGRARDGSLRAWAATPVASVAPYWTERLRSIRTALVGRGARRDPRQSRRGYRPLGSRGGPAAELFRAARVPGRRQHVIALLPSAR